MYHFYIYTFSHLQSKKIRKIVNQLWMVATSEKIHVNYGKAVVQKIAKVEPAKEINMLKRYKKMRIFTI